MLKLLVVDDEVEVCDFVKRFFSERDFRVFTANNGEEALSMMHSSRPQITLLDVRMPVMDGIETLKKMRKDKNNSTVIMVTADEDPEVKEEAGSLGVMDYLNKPLKLGDLERTVLNAAQKIRQEE